MFFRKLKKLKRENEVFLKSIENLQALNNEKEERIKELRKDILCLKDSYIKITQLYNEIQERDSSIGNVHIENMLPITAECRLPISRLSDYDIKDLLINDFIKEQLVGQVMRHHFKSMLINEWVNISFKFDSATSPEDYSVLYRLISKVEIDSNRRQSNGRIIPS